MGSLKFEFVPPFARGSIPDTSVVKDMSEPSIVVLALYPWTVTPISEAFKKAPTSVDAKITLPLLSTVITGMVVDEP